MVFGSAEDQKRGYFVYRFYLSAFRLKPDHAKFTPDLAVVSGLLTNDLLEASKLAFVNDLIAPPSLLKHRCFHFAYGIFEANNSHVRFAIEYFLCPAIVLLSLFPAAAQTWWR